MSFNSIFLRAKNTIGNVETKKNVIFFHVLKSGGTSIDTAIRQNYLTLDPRKDLRYQRVDSLKSAYVGGKFYGLDFERGDTKNNKNMMFNRDLAFYLMLDPRVKYLSGHFPMSKEFYEEFSKDYLFVTMLREPVEKWLSNYFYRVRRSQTVNGKQVSHWKIEDDLWSYLNSERGAFHGYDYIKYYGGIREDYNYQSKEAIEKAKDNLRKFDVIGLLDDVEGFCSKFEDASHLKLKVVHRNKSRKDSDKIDDVIRNKIKEVCKPEIEIYNYATKNLI